MMGKFNRKVHWENIYSTKKINEVSWYQIEPKTSISFINLAGLEKDAAIIDIGGGDSFFVDYLVKEGYTNITILDISEMAIKRAKLRLGDSASKVSWIVSDVNNFSPKHKYDFWHDRATFHFLTDSLEVNQYKETVENAMNKNGHFVIGTFSKTGPLKCSGIDITQYSKQEIIELFHTFKIISDLNVKHLTPFETTQDFVFCYFVK